MLGMNSDLKVKVGDYEVYDSGIIITHENKDITFEIKTLKVRIRFEKNEQTKEHDIKKTLVDYDTCLQLTLVNFDNSLGTGLTVPIEIGFMNGSKLYLQFIVYSLSDKGTKMFSYTWLTKKVG